MNELLNITQSWKNATFVKCFTVTHKFLDSPVEERIDLLQAMLPFLSFILTLAEGSAELIA